MEILEYFDEYKEPWRILSRDIEEELAKAYVNKLCYDKDSVILNGASREDVINAIAATIGIGRMKTFVHTLASLTQLRHMAVDAALARVGCEKFFIENRESRSKRTTRQHTIIDDRMAGIFAALKADTNSALDFSLLNKMPTEEKAYRIRCISLKLFCTLWLRCKYSNSVEANNILPATFPVYTMPTPDGRKKVFTPENLFAAMNESRNKAEGGNEIDDTSITYFLTADSISTGLYANTALVEAMWNNISSAPVARKYLDALSANLADITSPVTEETDTKLVECHKDYDLLSTLHTLAEFTSVSGCRELLDTDAVHKDKLRQEEIASLLYEIDNVDMSKQQIALIKGEIASSEVTVASVVYGDTPFVFALDELEDKLVDQVAIIPTLVDKGDKTYAVCECEYEQFLADPENQKYWQPADDLLYFKYIKQQPRRIKPQCYDVVEYMIKPDMKSGDSYIENLGASLIKPTLRCHTCGRVMLPTANFLIKLSLAAMNRQISTGGQLEAAPVKDSEGFILNHTANAIAQKMADLDKGKISMGVDSIAWPDVVAIGSRFEIPFTNVFVQPAYADYFMQITNVADNTQTSSNTRALKDNIARIAEAGRAQHLGFSRLDYLYTLVTLCDNAKINMKTLAAQSRVYYGAETILAYIRQARAAVSSKLYDTNIYDKIDMPFGYANIKPLLECIYSPSTCITKLGFSSFDSLISAITVSDKEYTIPDIDVSVDGLLPKVTADPSVEKEPERSEILAALKILEGFYEKLSSIAHAERDNFYSVVTTTVLADSVDKIYALSDATDVDNVISSAEVGILSHSMADTEFWKRIDDVGYLKLISDMADALGDVEVSARSALIGRSIADSIASDDAQRMTLELDAEAVGRIIVDPSTDLPSLSCLHRQFNMNPGSTYEYMVATYVSECGLMEDTGAFLADEAADFAIKIYYECVVDDAISVLIKKNIASSVTTEAYYSTGGLA